MPGSRQGLPIVSHFVFHAGMPSATRVALRSGTWLAVAAGLVAAAPALRAEETGETVPGAAYELAPITVEGGVAYSYTDTSAATAARTNARAIEVPQSITTVTRRALEDRAVTSVVDALATVSGVTQTNTVAGRQDAVIRRGFGTAGDGSILTDGLKTALPHAFNATVESVDVLKGPASTLYGVLDPGGMVNLRSKQPESTFSGKAYTRFDAMGAGRFSTTAGVDVTGPIAGTNFSYRLVAEAEQGDYWRNFGSVKNRLVAPSLRWDDGTTRLTLNLLHQTYDTPYDRGTVYDTEGGTGFLDISRRERLDEPFARNVGATDMARVEWERRLGGDWKASIAYALSRDSFTADQVRVTGYDASTGLVTRRVDTRDYYDTRTQSLRAEISGTAMAFGLRNELLFGATYNRDEVDRSDVLRCNTSSMLNVFDPTYGTATPCSDASPAHQFETLQTRSVYAQDRLHLSRSLIGVAGLRYEYYDTFAGEDGTVNTDGSGGALLPNLGLVWSLTPQIALYTNVSKSFRPNSSINSPYSTLAPEKGISYEAGMKFDLAARLSGTLAVYTSDKKNVAFSETVGGETVYSTAGLVRSKGVELDLTGQITDRLQLIGSFAFTDAKVKDDPDYAGKRLPNVAMRTGAIYLAYDQGEVFSGRGSLRYGGGLRGVSGRPGDRANSFELPGYGLVDLFAAYRIEDMAHPVTVQLNLNNVLDKTYYVSSIGNSGYSIEVGEPFNASLTVSVAF